MARAMPQLRVIANETVMVLIPLDALSRPNDWIFDNLRPGDGDSATPPLMLHRSDAIPRRTRRAPW